MTTTKLLVGMLTDYIRRNPKTSAVIAVNLGMYAATATKGIRKSELAELPSKLVELVPSIKDITAFVPALAPPNKLQIGSLDASIRITTSNVAVPNGGTRTLPGVRDVTSVIRPLMGARTVRRAMS